MSGAHAFLAPSSAHIRRECGAAARMLASYPKPDSAASIEGTTAHWVAYCMIKGVPFELNTPPGVDLSLINDEMLEACEVYYSDVIAIVPDLRGLHLEVTVECDYINEQTWGTPDNWYVTDPNDRSQPWTLTIWDFKYGHRYVPAFENWQLIEYASGIMDMIGINGGNDHTILVDLRVVQPRCYVGGSAVRSWKIRGNDLRGYFNEARMFEERALNPMARATSNQHCRDCVPHACSTAQAAAYNAIDISTDPQPFDMQPVSLSLELRKIMRAQEALKARGDALEAQALGHIRAGTAVPGFRGESSPGRERWIDPTGAEVITLGQVLGVIVSKTVPLTPNQVIKAGVPAELIAPLKTRPSGEVKLVEDDGSLARKVFG